MRGRAGGSSVSRAEPLRELLDPARIAQLRMSLEPIRKLLLELIRIRARELSPALQLRQLWPGSSSE